MKSIYKKSLLVLGVAVGGSLCLSAINLGIQAIITLAALATIGYLLWSSTSEISSIKTK
jgi:hypothetical protein|tara:strand:- start:1576 stop:1752 length:177 start_codon:yes stop_codon:yes gene_type:complete